MKYLKLLPILLLASCGLEVTYQHPETGIQVTEVVDGKFKPVVDFSKFNLDYFDVPKDVEITLAK